MELPKHFSSIADFRVQGRCLHKLGDILGLVLCATLCDCDDFSEIADYGHNNFDVLREELGFEFVNGIPSEDTLERVVRHLNSRQLEACFQSCLEISRYRAAKSDWTARSCGAQRLQAGSTPWCRWSTCGWTSCR